MRPQLRPDTYCAAVDGGAYILTPAGPVRLTGASIAAWITRLAPRLDGRATLAELTAPLSPQRRELVERVVDALHRAGVVRDLDEPGARPGAAGAGPLAAAEVREYASEIGYLGYVLGPGTDAFARYRSRPVLVIGSGPLLGPLAAAVLQSGTRRLRVAAAPRALAGLAPARRDPAQHVTHHPSTDPAAGTGLAGLLAGTGLVLHATEMGTGTGRLERACAAAGIPLAQAVLAGDEVWLVPAGEGPAGWSAAEGRLATAPAPPAPPAPDGADPDPATLVAAATRLVQGGFRALSGVAEPGPRTHLVRIPRAGWTPQRHRFLPHPFALPAAPTAAAALPARIAALAAGPRLTEEEFSRRAVRCLDPRLGLFTFPEHDWDQLPLQVCEAVVADPAGWLPAGSPPRVLGSGFTPLAARCEAALGALTRYATLLVDPRRLVDPGSHRPFATTVDADPRPAATWGYEVDAPDRIRLVPATDAFPVLREPAATTPAGAGAGYDWSQAVTAALVSHARAGALAALGRTARPYPRVDLTAAGGLDGPAQRCWQILSELAELPDCFDLTGPLGIPAFGFCRGAATVAVTAGATAGAALGEGLERVLRAVQARSHGQPGYAPPPAPPIPDRLRGGIGRTCRDRAAGSVTARQVAARLRSTGRVAVAVPLDHDPGVAAVLPYLVQVVVMDA